jgi:hypothetical protein
MKLLPSIAPKSRDETLNKYHRETDKNCMFFAVHSIIGLFPPPVPLSQDSDVASTNGMDGSAVSDSALADTRGLLRRELDI